MEKWNGMKWNDMEKWNGMEWNDMEKWNGMEWNDRRNKSRTERTEPNTHSSPLSSRS